MFEKIAVLDIVFAPPGGKIDDLLIFKRKKVDLFEKVAKGQGPKVEKSRMGSSFIWNRDIGSMCPYKPKSLIRMVELWNSWT